MMSKYTQALSIAELRARGVTGQQAQAVYEALYRHPGSTRSDLCMFTSGLRLSSICGRVNELIEQGLVREGELKLDRMTKKRVASLYVMDQSAEAQLSFI
jgi:hypothetical protein